MSLVLYYCLVNSVISRLNSIIMKWVFDYYLANSVIDHYNSTNNQLLYTKCSYYEANNWLPFSCFSYCSS